MIKHVRTRLMRSMMLALVVTSSSAAMAQDDPFKSITFDGYIDVYYGYSFNKPASGDNIGLRQFDIRHSGFSLAMAQINLAKKATLGKVGFRLELSAGRNADIINLTEPGGKTRYKAIHQAYGSYQANEGLTLDFGKFLTWIGYEGAASKDNDNYSRGFLFFAAQPLYHTGVRAAYTTGTTTFGLYGVTGWNEVEDANGNLTFGASVASQITPTVFGSLNFLAGSEGGTTANGSGSFGGIGFGTAGQRDVTMTDLVLTYQATPKLKLAINADTATSKGKGGLADGDWYGVAAYAKYAFTDKLSFAARYETVSDPDGVRTGADSLTNTGTATIDYSPQADLTFRLEYRRDQSNRAFYPNSSGGLKKKQSSITLSAVFKF